jgi:hypothetical protein
MARSTWASPTGNGRIGPSRRNGERQGDSLGP